MRQCYERAKGSWSGTHTYIERVDRWRGWVLLLKTMLGWQTHPIWTEWHNNRISRSKYFKRYILNECQECKLFPCVYWIRQYISSFSHTEHGEERTLRGTTPHTNGRLHMFLGMFKVVIEIKAKCDFSFRCHLLRRFFPSSGICTIQNN